MRRREFYDETFISVSAMLEYCEEIRKRENDLPAATVGAVMANCHRDPKKRKEPFKPSDIFSNLEPKPKERRLVLTPEEERQRQATLLAAQGELAFDGKARRVILSR